MKRFLVVLAIMAATVGCGSFLGNRPALPTAIPQLTAEAMQITKTGPLQMATPDGPTSTPAPFATPLPTPLPPGAPPLGHAYIGNENCGRCHIYNTDLSLPLDHKRRTDKTCLGCHRVPADYAPTPAPVAHSIDGREACLSCHLGGKNGAPVEPADHAGKLNDSCTSCHKPSN